MIYIGNDGGSILDTNYFDSPQAKAGQFYLSWNASTARLLVPNAHLSMISECRSVSECNISRGKISGSDALELLFEDHTDSPYMIIIGMHQTDRIIKNDGKPFMVTVWTRAGKVLQWLGHYRVVKKLPFLQPWKKSE